MLQNTGCKEEERIAFIRSANDTVKKTNNRRISVTQKPKRKSLTQMVGLPRKPLRILPRKMKINQNKLENRDRAEQRLKLKIGSFFIKLLFIIMSADKVMIKKAKPKSAPDVKPNNEGLKGKIEEKPLIMQNPKSKMIILK